MSAKASDSLEEVAAEAHDPAMDGILASIRKILSDDDSPPILTTPAVAGGGDVPAPAAAPPASPGATAASAVSQAPAGPAAPQAAAATPNEPLALTKEMMVSASNTPAQVTPIGGANSMLNASAAAATAASVGELIRAVSADRTVGVSRPGLTLEDIVREEMRPMIKDWLDRQLPGMVERLVRAEIERVVSRAMT